MQGEKLQERFCNGSDYAEGDTAEVHWKKCQNIIRYDLQNIDFYDPNFVFTQISFWYKEKLAIMNNFICFFLFVIIYMAHTSLKLKLHSSTVSFWSAPS